MLRRELGFEQGSPLDPLELEKSEQRIAELGYFRSVEIEPVDGTFDGPVEELALNVEERDTGYYGAGAAFTTQDGLNLSGSLGQRNIAGRGHRVRFAVDGYFKTGKRVFDASRARLAYSVPRFAGSELEFSTELLFQTSINIIDQFGYDRIGGRMFLKQEVAEKSTVN